MEPPGRRIPLPNHFPSESGSDDEDKQEEEALETKANVGSIRQSSFEEKPKDGVPGAYAATALGPVIRKLGEDKAKRYLREGDIAIPSSRSQNQSGHDGITVETSYGLRKKARQRQGRPSRMPSDPHHQSHQRLASRDTAPSYGLAKKTAMLRQHRQSNRLRVEASKNTGPFGLHKKSALKRAHRGSQPFRRGPVPVSSRRVFHMSPIRAASGGDADHSNSSDFATGPIDEQSGSEPPSGMNQDGNVDTQQANLLLPTPPEEQDREIDVEANSGQNYEEASREDLAVATPVSGRRLGDLPRAVEWPRQHHLEFQERRSKTKLLCRAKVIGGAALFAMVIIVAIVLIFFVFKDDSSTSEMSEYEDKIEGMGAHQSPGEYVASLLPEYTLGELENMDSDQSKAFDWVLSDSNLPEYPPWRVIQRFALATLFYATGGDTARGWVHSDNWMSREHHECDWFSVDLEAAVSYDDTVWGGVHAKLYNATEVGTDLCAGASGEEYQFILLLSNSLEGTLPPELSLLSSIKALSLRSNNLHGTLPTELGQLSRLIALDVFYNEITGSIPTEVARLSNLSGVFLGYNLVGGQLPTEIGMLTKMKYLVLESNHFSGRIPSELGLFHDLVWLALGFNELNGSLPSEIRSVEILLYNNSLTGAIPTEFGNLNRTTTLALSGNPVNGTIPTEIANMAWLRLLDLHSTDMTGPIPSELGRSRVNALMLSHTHFDGIIPSQLGLCSNMYGISLFNNRLSGPIPTELGQLQRLFGIQLNENHLSGNIPSQMGTLYTLEVLDLSHNQLTGSIPPELGFATRLQELRLDRNHLNGTLPSTLGLLFQEWLSFLTLKLESHPMEIYRSTTPSWSMSLSDNALSGSIPTELGRMTQLRSLNLSGNHLTGSISKELGTSRMLRQVILPNNNLTGSLCSEIGLLAHVQVLDVHQNSFTGVLPSELGILEDLTAINVANNVLVGSIPAELVALVATDRTDLFNLSGNGFTGTIAEELCGLRSSIFSFDCSDELCGCDCEC